MDKIVSIFKKVARLVSIILLLVLAVLEFVTLIGDLSGGNTFMGVISSLTVHLLLALLFGAPAILLLVKKDKEALITLSFLLGYLFISCVIRLIGYGEMIDKNAPASIVVYAIASFILGIAYGFVLILFLLEKVFGMKLMKLGFLVLIFGLGLIFILIILEIIMAIDLDLTFVGYLNEFSSAIVIPLVMVFGLMLLEGDNN